MKHLSSSSSSSSSLSSSSGPSRLLKYVFVGSKADAKDRDLLKRLGISHILNCTPSRKLDPENGCPNYFAKEQDFKYLRVSLFDNVGEYILAHLPSAFRFIDEASHYGGVLIHCHKGVSRSASIAIAYLMKKNQLSADESLAFVKSVRPIVSPNAAFVSQLHAYGASLLKEQEEQEDAVDRGGREQRRHASLDEKEAGCSSVGPMMVVVAGPPTRPTPPSTNPEDDAADVDETAHERETSGPATKKTRVATREEEET